MKLILGLGNPGEQYIGTRHNLGFVVLDELRRKSNLGEWKLDKKLKSEVITTNYTLSPTPYTLVLARPQTYMNNSGQAVKLLAGYYKIAPEDIVVVYDELDLHIGQIKIRLGGAAAGHHGVESIIEALKTDQFVRVRCGIGHWRTQGAEKKGGTEAVDNYVLQPFDETEGADAKKLVKTAIKALNTLLQDGLDKAQNQYN